MSEDPEWFAPKRYGYGVGLPISWQGWAILAAFLALAFFVGTHFADRPIIVFAILVPAVVALLVIAARTTRGGWRWRWGEKD
jgi:hypothetical protein